MEVWVVLRNYYDDLIGLWGFETKPAAEEFINRTRPPSDYNGSPRGWCIQRVVLGSGDSALLEEAFQVPSIRPPEVTEHRL